MGEARPHILRPAPPWRSTASQLTDCGRRADDVAEVVDRAEALARIRRDGVTRAKLTMCITCVDTSREWPTFEEDPLKWLGRLYYTPATDPHLADELRALAALAQAHPDDFQSLLEGLQKTVSLADARAARQGAARRRR